mmetsp:Transcript_23439/g.52608  ORF Transcript_23439/g.52608 Transcript_23439/m.52608 type:complete len:391 (+) Transcript_23439:2081-3253(+)
MAYSVLRSRTSCTTKEPYSAPRRRSTAVAHISHPSLIVMHVPTGPSTGPWKRLRYCSIFRSTSWALLPKREAVPADPLVRFFMSLLVSVMRLCSLPVFWVRRDISVWRLFFSLYAACFSLWLATSWSLRMSMSFEISCSWARTTLSSWSASCIARSISVFNSVLATLVLATKSLLLFSMPCFWFARVCCLRLTACREAFLSVRFWPTCSPTAVNSFIRASMASTFAWSASPPTPCMASSASTTSPVFSVNSSSASCRTDLPLSTTSQSFFASARLIESSIEDRAVNRSRRSRSTFMVFFLRSMSGIAISLLFVASSVAVLAASIVRCRSCSPVARMKKSYFSLGEPWMRRLDSSCVRMQQGVSTCTLKFMSILVRASFCRDTSFPSADSS